MIVVYFAVLSAVCLTIGFGLIAVPAGFICAGVCSAAAAVVAEYRLRLAKG